MPLKLGCISDSTGLDASPSGYGLFALSFGLCYACGFCVSLRKILSRSDVSRQIWTSGNRIRGSVERQVAVRQSLIWEDVGGMWAAHVSCLEVCSTSFRLHFLLRAVCHHLSGRIGVALSSKRAHTLKLYLRRSLVALLRLKEGLMNLYRSFGCLLETWVAEGYPVERSSSAEAFEKKVDQNGSDSASADSLRLTGAAIRSESEDSGVELPSTVSPLTSQHRVLTSQVSQLGENDLRPTSSSPALSQCSSSSSCFSARESFKVLKGGTKPSEASGLKVEEALRRTEPAWRRSLDGSLRRRCNTASISSSSSTPSIRSRVGSVGPGRPYVQPADEQRLSETPRVTHTPQKPAVRTRDPQEAACATGPEWDHLPPGFLYLEQMCRMLEEIARLQRENQKLQRVIENNRDETEETETKAACTQNDRIDSADGEKLDFRDGEVEAGVSSEAFRRRSVSDTWTVIKHRSKYKAPRAEHFPSTDVLLEEPETPQSPVETDQRKASNSLKQKISSLRWNEKSKAAKSISSSENEKKRIFGQFFKNRRKTTRY